MKNMKNIYDIEKHLSDQDPHKKQHTLKMAICWVYFKLI